MFKKRRSFVTIHFIIHLEKDNFNKEKEKEEIDDVFESKEKCQEDIKSGPLLELYLQQSNNDIDTKKVKAKKKIIVDLVTFIILFYC